MDSTWETSARLVGCHTASATNSLQTEYNLNLSVQEGNSIFLLLPRSSEIKIQNQY